jgi:hypothetical protein
MEEIYDGNLSIDWLIEFKIRCRYFSNLALLQKIELNWVEIARKFRGKELTDSWWQRLALTRAVDRSVQKEKKMG